ncbi:hypothetical protein AB4099_21305 [Bosea sp. 2KB_26]|uniref:YunG family protein n=1 Tax=Bosea sp. 2KB_26 TaxID=3237475 RepID=UPI003F8FF38E
MPNRSRPQDRMLRIREALEASWDGQTSYKAVVKPGNPALGQCYPTSRVVQHYYPETEIIKGTIWTGESEETHFWNGLPIGDDWYHIDLSWQQFPPGSMIREFVVLDRQHLGDSEPTLQRCALLLNRVEDYLRKHSPSSSHGADAGEICG